MFIKFYENISTFSNIPIDVTKPSSQEELDTKSVLFYLLKGSSSNWLVHNDCWDELSIKFKYPRVERYGHYKMTRSINPSNITLWMATLVIKLYVIFPLGIESHHGRKPMTRFDRYFISAASKFQNYGNEKNFEHYTYILNNVFKIRREIIIEWQRCSEWSQQDDQRHTIVNLPVMCHERSLEHTMLKVAGVLK